MLTTLITVLTANLDAWPTKHANTCADLLAHTLLNADFTDVRRADRLHPNAVLAAQAGHTHLVMPLVLAPSDYEMTMGELEDYVEKLLVADEEPELVRDDEIRASIGDCVLDVASVCLDPLQGRCRIHHVRDVLHEHDHTGAEPVHFFIPAESDTPVDAAVATPEMMQAPLAMARLVSA